MEEYQVSKKCKNCKHFMPERITLSDAGLRGCGICNHHPRIGHLVCDLSRGGCANFDPLNIRIFTNVRRINRSFNGDGGELTQ